MPCYTRRSIQLAAEGLSHDRLERAGQANAWKVVRTAKSITLYTSVGVVTYTNDTMRAFSDDAINVVKKAYTGEIVKEGAKRYGWLVEQPRPDQINLRRKA